MNSLPHRPPRPRAFTMVELLVVIAILAILAGLLLAGLNVSKRKAHEASCANNLRQFGIALINYRSDNRDRMPSWLSNLYPEYIKTLDLYICKADRGRPKGTQGSKPDDPWFTVMDSNQFPETDDNENNVTALDRNPSVRYNSYMYEFSSAKCGWWEGHLVGPPSVDDLDTNRDGIISWSEVKYWQLYHGDRSNMLDDGTEVPYSPASFPVIRCFWHVGRSQNRVINVSFDSRVFISRLKWEESSK